MWDDKHSNELSRRERQVVEIVMRRGRASAREIEEELPDAPTYSAVRSILRLLVERELLVKTQEDGRDWFSLPVSTKKARAGVLTRMVNQFFDNSVGEAALALLGQRNVKLSAEEARKLIELIEQARKS
ncbi:MAG: BlaI/MecI/CopY family transcriptional regulator [Verrucomicrobiaceae bacterium]|jgi:predicted transcriptional regulator|nr:BlaI/MecI/CopY family transcriptional regulator [Verrucomicrobiaceae bacterium]